MQVLPRRASQAREDTHRPHKAGRLLCKSRKPGQEFWGAPSEVSVRGGSGPLWGRAEEGRVATGSLD